MRELILEIANEVKMRPEYVKSIEVIYDLVCRFSGMSMEQIDSLAVEMTVYDGKERKNIYKNLPVSLKDLLKRVLNKHGRVEKFFSPFLKEKNLKTFVIFFKERRYQPRDFYFDGVLTFKNLKFNIEKDFTYDVMHEETYKMEAV